MVAVRGIPAACVRKELTMREPSTNDELHLELEKSNHRIAELVSLLQAMELINSTLDFHLVLDYLMDLAQEMTNCESTSVLLVENDRLCFVAASGKQSIEVKRTYLEKGEGVAGWVFEHKQAVVLEDVSSDPRFTRKIDEVTGLVTASLIAVPLKIEGRVIGVIEAVNKKEGKAFHQNDVQMLSRLGTSAAMAIQKAQLYTDLNELFLSMVKAVANAIEAKDPYTRGHSERIRDFSLALAKEMDMSEADKRELEIAALLHDVGKIGISESILHKREQLTHEEYAEIKKHPVIGADMLSSIKQLNKIIPSIRHHQEWYDGNGYPMGLRGEEIPLFARVIAVADSFDAMTSDRPYRLAMSDEAALSGIQLASGIQFDTRCVNAFVQAYKSGAIKSAGKQVQG